MKHFSSAEQLYEEFDPSQVVFKPAIPVPKKCTQKTRERHFEFADPNFQDYCRELTSNKKLRKNESGLYFAI